MFTAVNNQCSLIGFLSSSAKRAILGLLAVLNVNHSVRRPKPLKTIWRSSEIRA
jgi:hypothetical protein